MIVVSGLLTTSTFPALYAPDAAPDAEGTASAVVSGSGWFSAFRATCGVSFAFSIVTICISLMFILILQGISGLDDSFRQRKFHRVTVQQLGQLYHVTVASFMVSLGTAFAAAILAGLRFDAKAAGIILIVFVGVTAVVVLGILFRTWLTLDRIHKAKTIKPDREFPELLMRATLQDTTLHDFAAVLQRPR